MMVVQDLFNFIVRRLKNFKTLSVGEQIAYPSIGLGIILVLASVVLFLVG